MLLVDRIFLWEWLSSEDLLVAMREDQIRLLGSGETAQLQRDRVLCVRATHL